MQTSTRGIQFIKDRESFRGTAYRPTPNDVWTVGYGFTVLNGRPVVDGDTMSQEEADRRFPEILAPYEAAVNRGCTLTPNQNQFDAMVSFCFNVGTGDPDAKPKPIEGFLTSSVLRAHNRGDFPAAARAFGLWNKQAGVVIGGLTSRRALESVVYLEPMPGEAALPTLQTVDPEPKFSDSRINQAQIVGGLATATTIASSVSGLKASLDGLGPILELGLLGIVLAVVIYTIYQRTQLRKTGQA